MLFRSTLQDHADRTNLSACLPEGWLDTVEVPLRDRIQGQVEGLAGLLLYGWASVSGADRETISLWVGDTPVDAAVVRVEREDVRRAVHEASTLPGFEIEVPSQIWDQLAEDQQPQLQVRVNGQVLPSAVDLHLSRGRLLEELWVLRAQEAGATAATGPELQRYQYRLFAAIEHAVHAAILADLPPELEVFVRKEAERFGLSSLLSRGSAAR